MGRRRRLLLGGILAAGAVAIPAAWASHLFDDVPTSNPHHDDVAVLKEAGITAGCSTLPPLYCPADPVRRDQMATFLRRSIGRVGFAPVALFTDLSNDQAVWTDIATATITTGGGAGENGFLKFDGAFTAAINSSTGCPCMASFRVIGTGGVFLGGANQIEATLTEVPTGLPSLRVPGAVTGAAMVQTGTTYTVSLQGQRSLGAGTVRARGGLTVLYVPLGSAGTNVLAASP